MIIRKTYEEVMQPLTPEQIAKLKALKDIEPVPDEDCPAYSYEELKAMPKGEDVRNIDATIRLINRSLTAQSIEKAKKLSDDYPGFLLRLMENALNNDELVRKSM